MASYANIVIEQGATFSTKIEIKTSTEDAFGLTGFTAAGQIRRTYKSATAYDFTAEVTDSDNGEITLSLDKDETAAIKAGRYVYDVIVSNASSGAQYRAVEGLVEVTPSVTRSA